MNAVDSLVNVVRESDPSGDTLRDLMYALKNFHSYMRNCCRKGRLKDKKLMVPKSLLDRVDVDLLTISEYRRLHEEINLKWPGKKYEARRETGKALAVFGFRWGTRREESRLSRIADLHVDISVEFLVRASEGHTLKSPTAERRIPGLCLDSNENEVLKNWRSKRLQNCTEEDYILSDTLAGREPVPPSIFRALNVLISQVTGTSESEHSTHYHHLRHAFASWLLLRLLLPEGAKPPEYLQKEDSDWLIAGTNSFPRELRRRTQPWGGGVFLASQLLGHLHSSTTMGRYFHFAGELLRIYLQRCPWLRSVPAMLVAAMGRKPGTQELNASSAMRFAIALLGKRVQSDPQRLIQTGRLDEPQESPFYRILKETRLFLRYVQTPDGSIEDAANFFGWDRNRARPVGVFVCKSHSLSCKVA